MIKKNDFGTNVIVEERAKSHLRENKREPDQMQWLKELINLVHSDNRRLIIVIPPFRSDYKKIISKQSNLFEKIYNLKGVEVLNFYDSKIFSDDDFGDSDHLNEQGAIKLTNEIYKHFKNNNLL